jgi:hypothetical protein
LRIAPAGAGGALEIAVAGGAVVENLGTLGGGEGGAGVIHRNGTLNV